MANLETFSYDNKIVRNFAYASVIFGVIGMLVGIIAALQLVFPVMNFGLAETTYVYGLSLVSICLEPF
ncbi:MAG: hypothetical protein IPO48_00465 [Saprospiraceae bacterium]|nr:hypothetical protein [Saprospiraceae bacterium]